MVGLFMALVLAVPAATPREEFEALKADYEAKSTAWARQYNGEPDKPIPRDKVDNVGRYRDWPGWAYAAKAREFADTHPGDPAAADALFAMMELVSAVGDRDRELSPHMARAYALLAASHFDDPRIDDACRRVSFSGGTPDAELFLRAIAEQASDRGIRGRANLALSRFLATRRVIAARPWFEKKDGPNYLTAMIERLDPGYVRFVRATDPAALVAEIEAQFARTTQEYGDVLADSRAGVNQKTIAQVVEAEQIKLKAPVPAKP